MKEAQRANIVHGILSGYTICYVYDQKFIVNEPTSELLYESYDVYRRAIDRHKYDGLLTREDVLLLLVREKLWTMDGDKNFDEINKSLDELKLQLFKTFYTDSKQHTKLRATLAKVKAKQDEMYSTRYQFDNCTLEGLAEHARKMFVYINTVRNADNNPVDSLYLLENIILVHGVSQPGESQYRELVRTNPWSGYWTAYKDSLKPQYNHRLESLISFSRFYDNIRKNPECPDDEIIADDDLLDGWVVQQRKESEELKKEQSMKNIGTRGDGDVFIPARTKKDAQKIYSRNAPEVRARHRLRNQYVNAKGEVPDIDMPDVKREVAMKAQRQAMETIKKGK